MLGLLEKLYLDILSINTYTTGYKVKFYLNKERCMPNKIIGFIKEELLYVDFGVNVGYELSGNHFAIV